VHAAGVSDHGKLYRCLSDKFSSIGDKEPVAGDLRRVEAAAEE
jgi:hypothetical protein